ncbi:MAG TPA: hypothetical protein VFE53_01060 [Mucilaginibacter sp.]|jgi:hypothetical protein|nr:hypothetical protein [Mucilaginibacter sp.]
MSKNNLPTYAIVELLMRLSSYDNGIGNYKDHHISDVEVLVKTTGGVIRFPQTLVMQQFENPERIKDDLLLQTISSFKPFK